VPARRSGVPARCSGVPARRSGVPARRSGTRVQASVPVASEIPSASWFSWESGRIRYRHCPRGRSRGQVNIFTAHCGSAPGPSATSARPARFASASGRQRGRAERALAGGRILARKLEVRPRSRPRGPSGLRSRSPVAVFTLMSSVAGLRCYRRRGGERVGKRAEAVRLGTCP